MPFLCVLRAVSLSASAAIWVSGQWVCRDCGRVYKTLQVTNRAELLRFFRVDL